MTQLLKNSFDITAWLDHHNIHHYRLMPNKIDGYVVDVEGSVNLYEKNLLSLAVKFNHIKGFFDCSSNQLTNLVGSPESVEQYFSCYLNNITSLLGAPKSVGGSFSCSRNFLTNLKHGPQYVEREFSCYGNQLTSLEHCPKHVGEEFYCAGNPMLGSTQEITDFQEIYKIHKEFLKIKKEKNSLEKIIESSRNPDLKTRLKI